jgi:hypothetical protein
MATNDDRDIEPVGAGMLNGVSRSEIDIQIATARQSPRFRRPFGRDPGRGIEDFQNDVLTLATSDEETAAACFFKLPRKSRDGERIFIEGPSIRMAEIMASLWRNLHCAARVSEIGDEYVVAQAFAWDLESNYRLGKEVRRRITTASGRRFSEDMIGVTANAAISIALRNAIFTLVPRALIKGVLDEVKKVATGKNLPMDKRRGRAFKRMGEVQAPEAEVLKVLGRKSVVEIDDEDLEKLTGMYTGIREGETTWRQIYVDWVEEQRDLASGLRPVVDDLPPLGSLKAEAQP